MSNTKEAVGIPPVGDNAQSNAQDQGQKPPAPKIYSLGMLDWSKITTHVVASGSLAKSSGTFRLGKANLDATSILKFATKLGVSNLASMTLPDLCLVLNALKGALMKFAQVIVVDNVVINDKSVLHELVAKYEAELLKQ